MIDEGFFDRHLGAVPVMAILRGHGRGRTLELCARAWDAGLALVEVPVQSEDDLAALAAAVDAGRERGKPVGAGTVVSAALVDQVAAAGAQFTVAPGLDRDVAAASRDASLPHLPGVATATELQHARALGFVWIKAFPAAVLGADWFAAMRGPFPGARLVATGGVNVDNGAELLRAGAAAVSLGSSFAGADPDRVRTLTGAA